MGIDTETDETAGLQIGPTDQGMVRVYVSTASVELPMDFDPNEAIEIAEELKSAAEQARKIGSQKKR